jgi:hypothetical protein
MTSGEGVDPFNARRPSDSNPTGVAATEGETLARDAGFRE